MIEPRILSKCRNYDDVVTWTVTHFRLETHICRACKKVDRTDCEPVDCINHKRDRPQLALTGAKRADEAEWGNKESGVGKQVLKMAQKTAKKVSSKRVERSRKVGVWTRAREVGQWQRVLMEVWSVGHQVTRSDECKVRHLSFSRRRQTCKSFTLTKSTHRIRVTYRFGLQLYEWNDVNCF
jgi:hypothetical protein